MRTHCEYFSIVKEPQKKGRKTDVYSVVNHDDIKLGTIKWYGAWRQYCWFSEGKIILSVTCLDDIANFIVDLKEERQKKKKKKEKRCVFGMGSGRDQMCAHGLSRFQGVRTNGDPTKDPCKKCDRFTEEHPQTMKQITSGLKRSLRTLGRDTEEIVSTIQGKNEDEPVPQIRSDNEEE